jgi:hypothetical protein
MKKKGCNNYKIPHMNKAQLERQDKLSTSIPFPPDLLDEAEAAFASL